MRRSRPNVAQPLHPRTTQQSSASSTSNTTSQESLESNKPDVKKATVAIEVQKTLNQPTTETPYVPFELPISATMIEEEDQSNELTQRSNEEEAENNDHNKETNVASDSETADTYDDQIKGELNKRKKKKRDSNDAYDDSDSKKHRKKEHSEKRVDESFLRRSNDEDCLNGSNKDDHDIADRREEESLSDTRETELHQSEGHRRNNPLRHEEEELLPPAAAIIRKETVFNNNTQTQETQSGEVNISDDFAFFKQTVTTGGLDLNDLSLTSSPSSFVSSIRASVRGTERVRAFLAGLEIYLATDDSTLNRALSAIRNTFSTSATYSSLEPSLLKILLKVDAIQPGLIQLLLELFLTRAMDDDDEISNKEIPHKILQSMCWLDFICQPKDLAEHLLQSLRALNESNKTRLLGDAVSCLPEILPDSEHARAVEHLMQILRETRHAATPLIDALSDLTIPVQLRSELVHTVLDVLRSSPVDDVPVIVKFLLAVSAEADNATQSNTLREMRVRLSYLDRKVGSNTNEALVLRELYHGLLLHRSLCQTFLDSFKVDRGDEPCIDIWLLIALSKSASHSVQAKDCLRKIVMKSGGDRVFKKAVIGHRAALEGFQVELLDLCSSLLRVSVQTRGSTTLRAFAGKLYKWIFEEMDDGRSRQEIIHSLVSHCGAGETGRDEVDAALRCLRSIVKTDAGALALAPFSGYVRSLLNDLERFDRAQARYLFRVVSRLAIVDGEGVDELKILLRKLLMSPEGERKCLGIVGTVQLVACLTPSGRLDVGKGDADEPVSRKFSSKKKMTIPLDTQVYDNDEDGPAMSSRCSASDVKESMAIIDHMLRETRHVFTFDELGRMVERGAFDRRVIGTLRDTIIEAFEDWFTFDTDGCTSRFDNSLQEAAWFALDDDNNGKCAQILSILELGQTDPRVKDRLQVMCPMMRCLLACTSTDKDECPLVLLGCPIILPNESAFAGLEKSSHVIREVVCASIFFACNWIREIISCFSPVPSLSKEEQALLSARVGNLVQAERRLESTVEVVSEFVPPGSAVEIPALKSKRGATITKKRKKSIATSTTASKKGKHLASAMNNDEDSVAGEDESSEDDLDSQGARPPPKPKSVPPASEPNHDAEEEDVFQSNKPGLSKQSPLNENYRSRVYASLREISPNALQVFSVPNVKLVFGDITIDTTEPILPVPGVRILLDSCVMHLNNRLMDSSSLSPFNSNLGINLNTQNRAFEFEPEELIEMIVKFLLPTLRVFTEEICKRVLNEADDTSLTYYDIQEAIACLEATCTIIDKIIKYEPLRRSHAGSALLLEALRSFSFDFSSSTVRTGTLSEDVSHPTDARSMIAQATRGVFKFFVHRVCDTGILSNSLPSQILVVLFLKDLVALYDEMSADLNLQNGVNLRDDLSKLCETLLKRDWSVLPTAPQIKFGKQNAGVMLDIFHDFAAKKLEACAYTVNELRIVFNKNNGESEEASTPSKTFTMLDSKNISIFFTSVISSLAKFTLADRNPDEDELETLCTLTSLFAECILFTKTDLGAKTNILRGALRSGKVFLDYFVKKCMPILSQRLKRQQGPVLEILQNLQKTTRQLNNLCTHGKSKKDASILALTPPLRKAMESLLLGAKSMLKANNCLEDSGFFVGVLKARNLDGTVITNVDESEEA